MAKEYLFVGGDLDGERRSIPAHLLDYIVLSIPVFPKRQCSIHGFHEKCDDQSPPTDPYVVHYRKWRLRIGVFGAYADFYAEADLSMEEAVGLLLEKYPRPVAGKQG